MANIIESGSSGENRPSSVPVCIYDYMRQFRRYILPRFEEVRIVEVTYSALDSFRSHVHEKMGLSLKSCRNIIDGTFRAMMSDARKNGIGEKDHFAQLEWLRIQASKTDPFTAEERDAISKHFKDKHGFYILLSFMLFGTVARTSEIVALRRGDVDLRAGSFQLINPATNTLTARPKTAASNREIPLGEPIRSV